MTRSDSGSFSVGFVVFLALCVLMAGVFWVGSGKGIFSDRTRYVSYLPSTTGLRVGSEVKLAGVPVGSVEDIGFTRDPAETGVQVTLSVDKDVSSRVRQGSKMWLETEGLLGDYSVHISGGDSESPPIEPGGRIRYEARTMLEGVAGTEITNDATALLRNMVLILSNIQEGEGTLGKLLTDTELYENLNELVSSIKTLSGEVEKISREAHDMIARVQNEDSLVGRLLFSGEYEGDISRALGDAAALVSDLREIARMVRAGEGSAGRILTDSSLYDGAVHAARDVQRVAGGLADLLDAGRAERSLFARAMRDPQLGGDFESLLARLDRSAASLERILALVEQGEGTAGVLLHDPSLAISMRNLFLGVQDMGYVRNLVTTAESVGQEVARRERIAAGDLREAEDVERAVRAAAREGAAAAVSGTAEEGEDGANEANEANEEDIE